MLNSRRGTRTSALAGLIALVVTTLPVLALVAPAGRRAGRRGPVTSGPRPRRSRRPPQRPPAPREPVQVQGLHARRGRLDALLARAPLEDTARGRRGRRRHRRRPGPDRRARRVRGRRVAGHGGRARGRTPRDQDVRRQLGDRRLRGEHPPRRDAARLPRVGDGGARRPGTSTRPTTATTASTCATSATRCRPARRRWWSPSSTRRPRTHRARRQQSIGEGPNGVVVTPRLPPGAGDRPVVRGLLRAEHRRRSNARARGQDRR